MRYRLKILITASAFLCVLLAQVAVAGTVVGNVKKTLYVDGAKVEAGYGPEALAYSYCCITIGCEGNVTYRYNAYDGLIDEFAIYKGVLSDPCIASHASAPDEATYVSRVSAAQPLLYFRFEDTNGNNGADVNNIGTVDINGTYYGNNGYLVAGKFSNGAKFAPADGCDCIDLWDGNGDFSYDPNLGGDVTIEMWVKTSQDGTTYPRLCQHNNGVQDGYGVMFGSTNVGLIGGGNTNYITSNIHNDVWHHVVVTYDTTSANVSTTGSYYDEVMADDPCLYLKFDDAQAKDYSGKNCWVGYGSAASINQKVGGIGSSVYLNGTAGGGVYGVAATNSPTAPDWSIEFGDQWAFAPNDISFEMWIKATDAEQKDNYGVLFQQIQSAENVAPAVSVSGTAAPRQIRIRTGLGWTYTGVEPLDGEWHQIVVTYDEGYDPNGGYDGNSMAIQLYMDGDVVWSTVVTDPNGNAQLGPIMDHLLVGAMRDRGYTWNQFTGYIDEFAIYRGILDPNRVMAHYAAWQLENCTEAIDRGYGTVADINRDCKVDFADFASFALSWRQCNDPCDASCVPTW